MSIITHEVNSVPIGQRPEDGYFNLTKIAKAADKKINEYLRNKQTKEFLEALSADTRILVSDLVQLRKGGSYVDQGTWAHPQVAIHCAQWCSPEFAVLVTKWVFEWMTQGKTPQPTEPKPITSQLPPTPEADRTLPASFEQLSIFAKDFLSDLNISPELKKVYQARALGAQFPVIAPALNLLAAAVTEATAVPDEHVTPTRLGELYAERHGLEKPLTPRQVNQCLIDAGLQVAAQETSKTSGKTRTVYHLTEKGREFGVVLLDKASHSDKTVQTVRWLPSTVNVISIATTEEA